MGELWKLFCGESGCSDSKGKPCGSSFDPSSCTNHAFIFCFDILLLAMFVMNLLYKTQPKPSLLPSRAPVVSTLQSISAIFNGVVGLAYAYLGILTLAENMRKVHSVFPLHWWLLLLCHGLTWLFVSLSVSLWGKHLSKIPLRLLSIFGFLFAGISCILSLIAAIVNKEVSLKIAFDVLYFMGASVMLVCTYKSYMYGEIDVWIDRNEYCSLNGDSDGYVTPLAKAGFFSTMSFWWLNSLMKMGTEKTLDGDDIPMLRAEERAHSCYLEYTDQIEKQKRLNPLSQPSILWAIMICNRNQIFVSGFFALLKVITVSAGPLLLNAFIKVAEGNESFKYEGYLLAGLLFFSKCLESLSQRQWYFRSKLVGVKVRSLLTAAIYKKQLRLSNVAKITHSGGDNELCSCGRL